MVKYLFLILFIVSYSLQSQILTITTTSKSSVWTPAKVVKTGQPLTWKATATGMIDQVITTLGLPIFDFSVSRSSDVTIIVTSSDGVDGFKEITVNSLNINTIQIQNAKALTELSCTDNQLTELDLKNNQSLRNLFCHSNQLKDLNISHNKLLLILACFNNQIQELNVTNNTQLTSLSCSNNLLTNLDLTDNTQLISLECDYNKLEDLNVKNGNNTIIQKFSTTNNTNLYCIQVDDVNYSVINWKDIDSWTNFNIDCTFTNEPPEANDDQFEILENTILTIDAIGILSNDIDPDGDALSAIHETDVNNGILVLNSDGSFTYTPNQDFYGLDQFTYKANDGEFDSNIATVNIEVILENEPPISNDNFYKIKENAILDINENEGVLSNDIDPDGDVLTAELRSDASNGTLILNANGSFIYTSHQDFFGSDSFTYRAFDGIEYSNESSVLIDVQAIFDIIVPNAFTPNNDGINERFKPEYKGMEKILIAIYDTWGNLVYFEEGSEIIGWDGLVKGRNTENGNYHYVIYAFPLEGEKIELNGLFALIK